MIMYLIVCPLVFLAGIVDSIAGGGGLISLPAYIFAGVPAHFALGTNKMGSAMGTVVSTIRYIKNGYLKGTSMMILAACTALAALVGSHIGATLSLLVSDKVIQNMMLVVLPIVAFYVLRRKTSAEESEETLVCNRRMAVIGITAALIIGAYDGFYGPGTGTFLILVLTGAAKMNVRQASAITKVINLSSNVAALVTFMISGTIFYPLGLAAGVFSIAGHYIGSGLVVNNGQKIIRPVILVVLMLLFLKIILGK